MSLEIRHAHPSDYGRVIQHVNAWWGGREMAPMLPKLFFLHFEGTSFVAEDDDGKLVGVPDRLPLADRRRGGVHPLRRRGSRASGLGDRPGALRALLHGRCGPRADARPLRHLAGQRGIRSRSTSRSDSPRSALRRTTTVPARIACCSSSSSSSLTDLTRSLPGSARFSQVSDPFLRTSRRVYRTAPLAAIVALAPRGRSRGRGRGSGWRRPVRAQDDSGRDDDLRGRRRGDDARRGRRGGAAGGAEPRGATRSG